MGGLLLGLSTVEEAYLRKASVRGWDELSETLIVLWILLLSPGNI